MAGKYGCGPNANAKAHSLKKGLVDGEGVANVKASRLNKGGDTAFRGARTFSKTKTMRVS